MKNVPAPYKHQIQCENFIADKDIFALFMEMGTGKSKTVIDKTTQLYKENKIDCLIIIAPNAVKEQWITEQFPTHYPYDNWIGYIWGGAQTLTAKKAFEKCLNDLKRLFVFSINVEAFQSGNIELFIKLILEKRTCKVIVDESTKIKNGRRKPNRGKRAGAIRTNRIIDLFKDVKYKGILTGTPTPNNPFDLWSQFEFLKRDFFGMDYFYFTHHYGIMIQRSTVEGRKYPTVLDKVTYEIIKNILNKQEKITHQIVQELSINFHIKTKDVILIHKMKEFASYKNLDELKSKLSTITFSVKKKDCLDLPDKVYETLNCVMGKEQNKVYKELKKDLYTQYESKELTVNNKLVMYLRLQMITGGLFPYLEDLISLKNGDEFFEYKFSHKLIKDNGKVKVLLDDLENVSKDTSVIIWARFKGEIDLIEKSLLDKGYTCDKYYSDKGIEVIDNFKKGDFQYLIASQSKGGEGLNLQIATLHYYYSNSFRADAREQSEDRSHRIGQKNKVTYKDLICKNTVDERIYNVLKQKKNLLDYFRDIPNFLEEL
jgi:SNF2 family DNA or RNA helicase